MPSNLKRLESLNTHNAVSYHWRVWQLTGLLQPPTVPQHLYWLYAFAINSLVTVLFPLTLLANLFFTHNFQQLCENLTITITDIVANVKFINVYLVRRQLVEIQDLLKRLDARAANLNNADEMAALHKAVYMSKSCFRIFGGIFIFGTALSCLRVAIAKERLLLYPAWFGINWRDSDHAYWLIYAYQLFGLIVQAVQDCANDSYPPAYLCLLTGHMRALELRVRRIGYTNPSPRAYEQWRSDNYTELRDCIEDFNCIFRLHELIQQILSVACVVQFICSGCVQCTVAIHFLYVADSNDFSAMALSLVFFAAVTLEVFIICYFGDRLRTQSETLQDAFYACNWQDQLPQFKKNLIITLMRSQKPCVIYAGGYIGLSLETFVRVMKFTYSAFTLLLRAKL